MRTKVPKRFVLRILVFRLAVCMCAKRRSLVIRRLSLVVVDRIKSINYYLEYDE